MVQTIIVAVICNLVAVAILFGCTFFAARNHCKLALISLILTAVLGVGMFFAAPAISDVIRNISIQSSTLGAILMNDLHISIASINSVLYTLMFMLGYGIICGICSIVKYRIINSYKTNAINNAKMKRAKSINPKAERLAKKAMYREMRSAYAKDTIWYKRLLAGFIGAITGVVVGLVVLMPFGYIGEDINKAQDGKAAYLEEGFDYTLNGLIDEKIEFKFFDWLVSAEIPEVQPETPVQN